MGETGLTSFDRWFASYLGQSEAEVQRLLGDKTATRFLIAWSTLESKCFDGTAKAEKFAAFAHKIARSNPSVCQQLRVAAEHFHDRYQDSGRYKNLMHERQSDELKRIIDTPLRDLTDYQVIFMLLFVVFRFRNNIFHGNKGVLTWLQYEQQINLCLEVMQCLISATVPLQAPEM